MSTPGALATRGRWSPWTLLSLALSVGLCPLITVCAIPVALIGLRDVRTSGRRGRRVAITALWIACILTPVTTVFAIWWDANVRMKLIDGPIEALRAGQHGDVVAFMDGLGGPQPGADTDTAVAFLDAVTSRWGAVVSMRQSESASEVKAPEGAWWVGYDVMFEHGATPGRAFYVLQAPGGQFVLGFEALVLGDASVQLRWPPEGNASGTEVESLSK